MIVSRFSSLSGCLNPKVKAFSPPVYIPFTGGLLFSAGRLEPMLEPVATFVDALSCNARKQRHAIATEALVEFARESRLRVARELVRFGKQNKKWNIAEPFHQLPVDRRQRMTRVHDHDHAGQARSRFQIGADEVAPVRPHGLRDARVAVPRQIRKTRAFAELVEVDGLGSSGRLAGP